MSETMTTQVNTVLTLLRRLPPRERLRVVAQVLPEVERELAIPAPPAATVVWDEATLAAEEMRFKQMLLEQGLLTEIKDPLQYPTSAEQLSPVTVEGTPLSEMIIAERR